MGNPYRLLDEKFLDLECNSDSDIVVEIGSGIAEGSTEYMYNWAKQRNLPFYSIDVDDKTKNVLGNYDINFVIQTGHQWCKDVLPTLGKKIKVLYLDNFDYIWESTPDNLKQWEKHPGIDVMLKMFEQKIKEYAERNIELTRENSMEEHRLQTLYCLPHMSQQSVVLMDDTYIDGYNGIYGKCATAIPLLIEAGYQLSPNDYTYAYRK
jgi:hypothetical protein